MSDQQITCAECGNIFVFSAAEQQFYSERQLASPPKRCKACRQARRASQGEGGAGGRGPSRDRGPRSGGPSGYRSPTQSGNGYGGAGAGGSNPRFAPRPAWGGQQQGSAPAPRGDRPSWGNRAPRSDGGGFNGAPRSDGGGFNGPPRDGGGFNGPARGAPQGRGAPGESSWGTRPNEGGQRPPRGPRGARPPGPPRETKPNERPPGTRPERPKYDITCAECGTQSQVPFKPLEGRQVFCQPCYRARKGTATTPGSEETAVTEDTDAGIVE